MAKIHFIPIISLKLSPLFAFKHFHFDVLDSTNQHILSLKNTLDFSEGLLVTTNYQSEGRGQKGNCWQSNKDENLLLSIVVEPRILIEKQFDICKFTSLALIDLLSSLGIISKIKWPNDILIDDKKVAGILIENIVEKNIINYSVIGIGLNINQVIFNYFTPKATSLKLETQKHQDSNMIRDRLLTHLFCRIEQYRSNKSLDLDYHEELFLFNQPAYFHHGNKLINGLIQGVASNGKLIINIDGELHQFNLQEIKYIF